MQTNLQLIKKESSRIKPAQSHEIRIVKSGLYLLYFFSVLIISLLTNTLISVFFPLYYTYYINEINMPSI